MRVKVTLQQDALVPNTKQLHHTQSSCTKHNVTATKRLQKPVGAAKQDDLNNEGVPPTAAGADDAG